MKPRPHPYRGWIASGLLLTTVILAPPASAAPRRRRPAQPPRKAPAAKPPAAKPAPEAQADATSDIISHGEETVLVDHFLPERPTLVLFYQPAVADDAQVATFLRERSQKNPQLTLRVVELQSLDQPIAKQYEITATPSAFVYDRNKNLLGKGNSFQELGPLVGKALRTARLKWINEDDPTAAEVYRTFGGGARPVPEIMKTMSLHPGLMEAISQIAGRYHFSDGFLTRRDHEIIASYVSALNKCKY